MNKFAVVAAEATSEIVQSSGLEGYVINPEGLADDLEDKARELAELIRASETPDDTEVSGPLVDLHQMVLGLLEAYAEVLA